jgi:N-formylglutamate deformylase
VSVFSFVPGDGPLLVSMPHDGTGVPADIAAGMTEQGRAVPDTDWHVSQLYDFLSGSQTSVLCANYSRYVVDLNRPADGAALYPGQDETTLCPVSTFDRQPIYLPGNEPNQADIALRTERYWRPYHQQLRTSLEHIHQRHGYALLWDAHSIRSEVPRFFEGQLPDFNLGTVNGRSCPDAVLKSLQAEVRDDGGYSVVSNARFKGGYITRHYSSPEQQVFAVQLELSQSTYMDESGSNAYQSELAARVRPVIERLLACFQSQVLASR